MINLFSDEIRRDPFAVYDQVRAHSPVLHHPQFGLWMVFDYEGVKRTLNDHEAFSSRRGPEWLVFLDPPRHKHLRALIAQAFTPRMIAHLEPRIRELSRELLNQVVARGEMDLATDYAIPLPMLVIADMLGVDSADQPRFRHWSDVILNMSHTIPDGGEAAKAVEGFRAVTGEMSDYLAEMTSQRQTKPQDDLLTRLVEAEVDGARLGHQDILWFFQLLLVAGSETTTNLINNAILCLLDNPAQLARLKGDPSLLPLAIEEVLRYRSPVQWMFRIATRDVELGGQVIPAGQLVLPMIGSANRDPGQFPDAHRFDVGRNPNPHIAFGHGIHFCLGAALARLEASIALPELLSRLPTLALAEQTPWQPRQALHVHGPSRLPVRFTPGEPVVGVT